MLLLASTYFVLESLAYVIYAASDPDAGPFTPRILSIYVHGALAIPLLFVAPLQFHPGFRKNYPQAHRWTGRVFLTTSIVTAALAIILSLEYEFVGSRPALMIFGCLWILLAKTSKSRHWQYMPILAVLPRNPDWSNECLLETSF